MAAASEALAAPGLGGWIVTMYGSDWGRGGVTLAPVQTIGELPTPGKIAPPPGFETAPAGTTPQSR
ncbi:hypothetical protein [Elioraea sp.]|uniref:hypothetical protein n=1 Tax=Elioraea sp. TaxID=2185103 RepID=UPI0025C0F45F|nr:hypothetical protein [Elioraea sp.]